MKEWVISVLRFLYNLWVTLLGVFRLTTVGAHNRVCAATRDVYEAQIKEMDDTIGELTRALEASEAEVARLTPLAKQAEDAGKRIERMRSLVETYKKTASENLDFVKAMQKQVSECFHGSENFSFPKSPPYPGSTSIATDVTRTDDGGLMTLRIRSIALDNITAQINQAPDAGTRLGLILGQMSEFGALELVMDYLIRNGAVVFSLGYNADNTSYEVFCEVTAKIHHADSILVIPSHELRM